MKFVLREIRILPVIAILVLLVGCASQPKPSDADKSYINTKVDTETSIVVNINNKMSFPPDYMNGVEEAFRNELSKSNKIINMNVLYLRDSSFKDYVNGTISPNKKIWISNNPLVNEIRFKRAWGDSLSDGYKAMAGDKKSFSEYEYTLLINLSNTTKQKNIAASLLSALTVFAIPEVRVHTMSVSADIFKGPNKIGKVELTKDYEFSYGWGVDKAYNIHTEMAKLMARAIINELHDRAEE